MTQEAGGGQAPESAGGPKRNAKRFRIGSAAKFWAVLAVLVWLLFYIGLQRAVGLQGEPIGWTLAWYFSLRLLGVALVAAFFQNLWTVAGGSLESNVAAWIASLVVAFFLIKLNIGPGLLGGMMMGR